MFTATSLPEGKIENQVTLKLPETLIFNLRYLNKKLEQKVYTKMLTRKKQ